MDELTKEEYDTVIVGKHRLSRSQEFLFGSVAVSLVREAPVNVLTIKAPGEAESEEPATENPESES